MIIIIVIIIVDELINFVLSFVMFQCTSATRFLLCTLPSIFQSYTEQERERERYVIVDNGNPLNAPMIKSTTQSTYL